jgi:hypothetical protein
MVDLTGQRFGRLLVLRKTEQRADRRLRWVCLCDCGTILEVRQDTLHRCHANKSCGCWPRERMRELGNAARVHGLSQHPLYQCWWKMNDRCVNPDHPRYIDYGGRGITVCKAWQGTVGFVQFLTDMGEKPNWADGGIDRIDNNANYSCGHCDQCVREGWPANCRWATRRQQSQNRRRSGPIIPMAGENHPMVKLTEAKVIRIRQLKAEGWTERALADEYSVTPSNIHAIVTRRTWPHVP